MRLLEFPHSHYCEKARWALDFKGIPFQSEAMLPGYHAVRIKRIASGTCVPVLINSDKVIQGSDDIIDYLDEKYPDRSLTPTDPEARRECMAIEQKADQMIGGNLRRILYYRLLDYPKLIKFYFMHRSPFYQGMLFSLLYPILRKRIRQKYDITESRVQKSITEFNQALDWLDKALADREFLVGNQFSRADLSVAAMLSILCCPPEHPVPWPQKTPDATTNAFMQSYRNRHAIQWALGLYRNYRKPQHA